MTGKAVKCSRVRVGSCGNKNGTRPESGKSAGKIQTKSVKTDQFSSNARLY